MNVASLELCKELFELLGWEPDDKYPCWVDNATKAHAQEGYPKLLNNIGLHSKWVYGKQYGLFIMYPAYTLGYLTRKLPHHFQRKSGVMYFLSLHPSIGGESWFCSYENINYSRFNTVSNALTPEDAAAKLAIELAKAGIIGRPATLEGDSKP